MMLGVTTLFKPGPLRSKAGYEGVLCWLPSPIGNDHQIFQAIRYWKAGRREQQ